MAGPKPKNKTKTVYVGKTAPDPERQPNSNLRRGGPGRPRGVPNKTTRMVKEAILLAAEIVGADGKGKDGLVGYLVASARTERKTFLGLIGRVLPTQVQHTVGHEGTIHVIMRGMSEEEAAEEYYRSLQTLKEGGLLIDAAATVIDTGDTEEEGEQAGAAADGDAEADA